MSEPKILTVQSESGHTITFRDFKRSEYARMDPMMQEDFFFYEVIQSIEDSDGNKVDPDDLYASECMLVLKAIHQGLNPNGRRGSRR